MIRGVDFSVSEGNIDTMNRVRDRLHDGIEEDLVRGKKLIGFPLDECLEAALIDG